MTSKFIKLIANVCVFCTLILSACSQAYAPKRYEYFRISFPEHEYTTCDSLENCSFLISKHAKITDCDDTWIGKSDQWFNITYPEFNGSIHISYKKINKQMFQTISEETRALAYKHTVRASSINESFYANDTNNVYGILYELGGAAASQIQFFLTDSTTHFLRGSLYFDNTPNFDSIAPVSTYIEQDIIRLVESIKWN